MGKYWKALLILLVLLSLAAGAVLLLASRSDIGAGTVAAELEKASGQHLQADLSLSSISGNPFRGFRIRDLSIMRDERLLFSAQEVVISFKPLSLLTGSPRIRSISFDGALLEWSQVAPLLSGEETSGTVSLPFDIFRVNRSIVRTPAGDLKIEEGRVTLREGVIDASGSLVFMETTFSLKAKLEMAEGRLDLGDIAIRTAGGALTASGRILPVADLTGVVSDLDIKILERFWPDLAKQGYSGNLTTTFSARGAWPEVEVKGDLHIPKGEVYGIEMEDISSPWSFSGRALEIGEIRGKANGTAVSGRLQFVFSAIPPVTTIDITAREAEAESWRRSFSWLSLAEGTIDSMEVRLQGPFNALSGTINISTPDLTLAGQPLSEIGGTLQLEKSSTIGLDLKARWLDSPVTGKGDITIGQRPVFDLTLSGNDLDLSRASSIIPVENLALLGKAAGSVRIFGAGPEIRSEGTIKSARINAAGETIERPDIRFAYSKGTITINSMSALWRGSRVAGSGRITSLGNEKGAFDLAGTLQEGPVSSVAGFVPALKELGLEGRVSAEWNLKGPVRTPTLALEIRSPRVDVPEKASLSEVKILTKVAMSQAGETPDIRLDMAAERLQFNGGTLSDLRTAFTVASGTMNIENAQGEILGARISVTGSARLPSANRPGSIDLKGTASGVDLSVLGDRVPFNVKGPVEAGFTIKGDLPGPELAISGQSPSIVLAGLNLSDLSFNARGNGSKMTLEELKGSAGEGVLTAKGTALFGPDGLDMDFSMEGSDLDLALITKDVKGNGTLDLSGILDVSLSGSMKGGKWNGRGEIFSKRMTAFGLDFEDASLPVVLEEESIRTENAVGKFYGGTINADGSIETATGRWNIRAAVRGADIDRIVGAVTDLEGSISGKGDLDLSLSGALGRNVLVTGSGNLTATDGEISGFKALKAISSAYGMSSIRYRMIDANFKVDGNVVSLLPGSRATAYVDDPLYRYLGVDGPAGPGGNLNLYFSGLVNVQALNTLLGAIHGLAMAGSGSPEALLEGLIGGVAGGLGRQDFRDTSFRIGGTWSNPSFHSFRIAPAQGAAWQLPESGGVGQTQQNGTQHKLTISIPTGEGAGPPTDTGEDIKRQVIEQLLRNILPDNE
ncbi:MAG TPA: AsmA-like C-terminal region-containing protein [Synergistales bacterium]|nr:AsmA-like C-terminal region-containing protein [Synergistales bacterium]